MKLTILPLASGLNPPQQVAESIARVSSRLAALGIEHEVLAPVSGTAPGPGPLVPDVLLVVTGGTEHLALNAAVHMGGPVFLLAHGDQNSLPAALEILTRLQQQGRPGKILLLTDTGGGGEELARLAAFLRVRAQLAQARLARIGAPSDWLVASAPDPAVVASSWGPSVIDIPMAEVEDALRRDGSADEVSSVKAAFVGRARSVVEPQDRDLTEAARVVVALRHVVTAHRCQACTVRCFDLVLQRRTTGCLALSWLLDHGIVAGCEGDVPAALTMMWLQAMGGGPGFMANPQDLDVEARTLWLAHCTVPTTLVRGFALRSHFESSLGVGIEGEFAPGPATVARIGGTDLRRLFASDGEILTGGVHPFRCRTQVQVRLASDVRPLLERPLGNHHVLVRGHHAEALRGYHSLFVAERGRT